MSDSYKPTPWQVPNPNPAAAPISVQVDVKVPADANQVDKGVLMQVAQKIVQGNASLVDRFVNNQRQQVSLTGVSYHQREVTGDGLNARYTWNGGYEQLKLEVYPAGGEKRVTTTSDTNLDGYICWIHGQPNYPNDIGGDRQQIAIGPFVIMLNGYALETSVQPRDHFANNCMGYAAVFGKTALLCASYTGDVEHMNDNLTAGTKQKPLVPVPNSVGQIPAFSQIDGTFQRARADTFGYWIFDWMSDENPLSFIKVNISPEVDTRWNHPALWSNAISQTSSLGQPNIWGGIFFPDLREGKSPLKPRGDNYMGILPGAGAGVQGQGDSIVPCVDVFVAEFYDRGKYVTLTQSWTVPARANQTIAANMKPLLFGNVDFQIGYSTGGGSNIEVNLDPSFTKDKTNTIQPHDHVDFTGFDSSGAGPGNSVTSEQAAVIVAWRLDNQHIYEKWAKDLQDKIDAWTKEWADDGPHAKELNQAYNVTAWWENRVDANGKELPQWVNFDDRTSSPQDDGSIIYGPVQEYVYSWNAPYKQNNGVNPLPQAQNRWFFDAPFGHPLVIDTAYEPGSPSATPQDYGGSFFGGGFLTFKAAFDLADQYVKDPNQNTKLKKQKAYDDIVDAANKEPPKFTSFPNIGKSLGDFSYQKFTNWNYNNTLR